MTIGSPTPIDIELVLTPTGEVRALVDELEAILAAEYPPEQRHGLALEVIFQPHIKFFIARLNGAAAGCGGIALFDGFAELKRMYVREAARGRGVAPALLARLEATARESKMPVLRLETGTNQLAALRFYQREGYRRCVAFGDYAAMPAQAIATSLFMEKPLPAD